MSDDSVVTCFRPVNQPEFEGIAEHFFMEWPDAPQESISFYFVNNEQYARELMEEAVEKYGSRFLIRFAVNRTFLDLYRLINHGAEHRNEWCIPARDIFKLNSEIVGIIEVIDEKADGATEVDADEA